MNPSEFHSSRKFTPTPSGRIAYVECGAGPVALFMHGFPLNAFQWRDVLEDLATTRRCVAIDLMGLGYSEIPDAQDISFDSQAHMIASFLDAQGIGQVDLVGNDSGGGMAQVFAATHPARVRSLTLTDCEVNDLWMTPMLEPLFAALASGMAAAGITAIVKDQAAAHAQLGATYEDVKKAITPEIARLYFEPLVASDTRRAQLQKFGDARRNMAQLVAAAPKLRESKFPTQVIWGEADTAFDMTASLEWLRGNLGNLRRIVTVPRAKVFWPEEHPRLLSAMLKEFWLAN
jgi:pimeloyl-ACP methyl ester carboxylesterase